MERQSEELSRKLGGQSEELYGKLETQIYESRRNFNKKSSASRNSKNSSAPKSNLCQEFERKMCAQE